MEKNSFTLAEMLVAITIFIIILGIVIVRYDKAREAGQDAQRVKDLQTIAEALEKYYLKNNKYPSTSSALVPEFLGALPKDPQDQTDYTYCIDSSLQKYALMAKLKTKSQALETDYDKDWPDTETSCDCNPGTGETDPENQSPYTYCIKNP